MLKNDFTATISDQFHVSSKWREAKARRFAHDARNAMAAKRLLELESEINVSDSKWEAIEALVSDPTYLAAVSETNRSVCFTKHPRDFAAWLENLHSNIARQ